MKCYEVTKCSQKERDVCYLWNNFRSTPDEMEDLRCWVLKGVYQPENKEQFNKCQRCSYYIAMNKESAVVADYDSDIAVITCEGFINNDRTRGLEKVWETLRQNGKINVILNLANVNNIYSCGLGMIIKIHKEAIAAGGRLLVVGATGFVQVMFESTKLHRLLHQVKTMSEAREFFDALRKSEEEKKKKLLEEQALALQEAKPKTEPKPVKIKRNKIPCWEYFNDRNPKNASNCNECFRKLSPSMQPCWIVDGVIEGVSFQYVNEECEDCPYYQEFGKKDES